MTAHAALEALGYVASVLVAVSLMMKSLVRLRAINFAGALLLAAYGAAIGAWPVAALNAMIAGVDLWFLVQMRRTRDAFTLLEVAHDSEYLRAFVAFHAGDIATFIPGYAYAPAAGDLHVLVLRNMVPAGVLVARPGSGEARVLLDYVIAGYRDFGVGRFLFDENAAFFRGRGVTRFVSEGGHAKHAAYLARMGFRRDGEHWVRALGAPALRDRGI